MRCQQLQDNASSQVDLLPPARDLVSVVEMDNDPMLCELRPASHPPTHPDPAPVTGCMGSPGGVAPALGQCSVVPVDLDPPESLHDAASLERVTFDDSSHSEVVFCTPDEHRHVTTTRGTHSMLPLHIPVATCTPVRHAVVDFAVSVCRASTPPVAVAPPPRRRARTPPRSVEIRRRERLAKKSHLRATKPAVQAQNVLMRRLGLTTPSTPPDAISFQLFVDMFSTTLSESHCEALDVLLPNVAPFVAAVESDPL